MYGRRRSEASSSSKVSNTKSKLLSNLDVSDFIVQNKIKTQTQLLAIANIQKEEGKKDLGSFVFSRTSKSLDELISQTWKMQNAQITLERQRKCRMDIIQEVSSGSCAEGSPNTKHCHEMYTRRTSEASSSSKVSNTKSKLLSNLDVSDFIVQNKIKTQTQLLATANIQKEEGKRDFASFVFSPTSKSLNELISQTWKMQNAQITLERQTKCWMDIIQEVSLGSCAEGCNGSWLKYAEEVLTNNKLHPVVFGTAVSEHLTL